MAAAEAMIATHVRIHALLVDPHEEVIDNYRVPLMLNFVFHRGLPDLLRRVKDLYFWSVKARFHTRVEPAFSFVGDAYAEGGTPVNLLAQPALYAQMTRRILMLDITVVVRQSWAHDKLHALDEFRRRWIM